MVTRRSNKSRKPNRPRVPIKVSQPSIERPDFSQVPPVPYIWGYARVSTAEQSLDMQITALKAAGVEDRHILTDKLSGKTAQRLEFKRLLKHLQPGDTVIVYSLSRLFPFPRLRRSSKYPLRRSINIRKAEERFKWTQKFYAIAQLAKSSAVHGHVARKRKCQSP